VVGYAVSSPQLPSVNVQIVRSWFDVFVEIHGPFQCVEKLPVSPSAISRICSRVNPAVLCVDGAATLAGQRYHRRWEAIVGLLLEQHQCERGAGGFEL
jgi:hypothetical protein